MPKLSYDLFNTWNETCMELEHLQRKKRDLEYDLLRDIAQKQHYDLLSLNVPAIKRAIHRGLLHDVD